MLKTSKRLSIVMPSLEEDRVITQAALSDPDAQPLTDAQLSAMVPLKSLRGRPKAARTKQLVSVRYSPEVVMYFKSTGDGWQSRMDGVLLDYVGQQSLVSLKKQAKSHSMSTLNTDQSIDAVGVRCK